MRKGRLRALFLFLFLVLGGGGAWNDLLDMQVLRAQSSPLKGRRNKKPSGSSAHKPLRDFIVHG